MFAACAISGPTGHPQHVRTGMKPGGLGGRSNQLPCTTPYTHCTATARVQRCAGRQGGCDTRTRAHAASRQQQGTPATVRTPATSDQLGFVGYPSMETPPQNPGSVWPTDTMDTTKTSQFCTLPATHTVLRLFSAHAVWPGTPPPQSTGGLALKFAPTVPARYLHVGSTENCTCHDCQHLHTIEARDSVGGYGRV